MPQVVGWILDTPAANERCNRHCSPLEHVTDSLILESLSKHGDHDFGLCCLLSSTAGSDRV